MSLRLIAGKFGGRIIETPKGSVTHPMSERVRSSLFNIISSEIEGAKVLDAFAGSGSLGIEALSRGAESAVFLDDNSTAIKTIERNIEKLEIKNISTIVNQKVNTYVKNHPTEEFDLIFADPPYDNLQLSTVFELLKLLKSNGLMVLSYVGRGEVPQVDKIVVVDNRSYGKANLAFYRKK